MGTDRAERPSMGTGECLAVNRAHKQHTGTKTREPMPYQVQYDQNRLVECYLRAPQVTHSLSSLVLVTQLAHRWLTDTWAVIPQLEAQSTCSHIPQAAPPPASWEERDSRLPQELPVHSNQETVAGWGQLATSDERIRERT